MYVQILDIYRKCRKNLIFYIFIFSKYHNIFQPCVLKVNNEAMTNVSIAIPVQMAYNDNKER